MFSLQVQGRDSAWLHLFPILLPDFVELVQDEEAGQVLVLGDVLEEANYELEEAVQLQLALLNEHIHDEVLH